MSKVVYLFGAGASFGTLPLVTEMKDQIDILIKKISSQDLYLSETEHFKINEGEFQSKRAHQKDLIQGLEDLRDECKNHFYNGLKKLDRNLITLKFLSYEKIKTNIHSRF